MSDSVAAATAPALLMRSSAECLLCDAGRICSPASIAFLCRELPRIPLVGHRNPRGRGHRGSAAPSTAVREALCVQSTAAACIGVTLGAARLTFCGDQLGLPNLTHRTNASGRNTELAGIPENDIDKT